MPSFNQIFYPYVNPLEKKNRIKRSPHCQAASEHIVPSMLNNVIVCQEPVTVTSVAN